MSSSQRENSRVVIILGIIAAILAVVVYVPNENFWIIIKTFLAVNGFLGFLYILLTAASLKYGDKDGVAMFTVTERVRKSLYDTSIDVFGLATPAVLVYIILYPFVLGNTEVDAGIQTALGLGLGIFSTFLTYSISSISAQEYNNKSKYRRDK